MIKKKKNILCDHDRFYNDCCLHFQVVIVVMNEGDQVYMQLISGRKLCSSLQHNIFTGYMVYPKTEEYGYEYNHGY